ncbi:hypothetical protein TNCV_2770011 [Trichonephila clavipes]|nr:hypothetical protein TNCV_2770011 [Trichonephila clavipes]
MDDNSTCHRTLAVQDCLDSEGIQRLVWPARTPDLNPIENVWDALGRQVAGRNYPPTNKNTVHSQRNGINCLNSCWIMLCKLWPTSFLKSPTSLKKAIIKWNEPRWMKIFEGRKVRSGYLPFRTKASTLQTTPKRSSSRDVGTSSYRYHTATYSPASVSVNRRANDTIFVASLQAVASRVTI